MAIRTLSEMRDRIAREIGQDSGDSEIADIIDDNINRTYSDLVRRHQWSWLRHEGYFSTVAPHTTGTVAVSGTAVTGTGTGFSSSDVGRYITFADSDSESVLITAVTSAIALTIQNAPSDTVSGSTYSIFQPDYELNAGDNVTIEYLEDTKESYRIYQANFLSLHDQVPNFGDLNYSTPEYFAVLGYESTSANLMIRLFPIPDEVRMYRYSALKNPVLLSTASDSVFLPERFQDVIEEGALARLCARHNMPELQALHTNLYEAFIQDMVKEDKLLKGQSILREENDLPRSFNGLGIRIPPSEGGQRFS